MAFTTADLLAIKAELTNDPKGLGLTVLAADDEANANKLNAMVDGVYTPTLPVLRRTMTSSELFNAISDLEHQSLSDQQARWLQSALVLGQFDPFANDGIVGGIRRMFGALTATRQSFDVAIVENGSRIEQMFQAGLLSQSGFVTPSTVANARNAV